MGRIMYDSSKSNYYISRKKSRLDIEFNKWYYIKRSHDNEELIFYVTGIDKRDTMYVLQGMNIYSKAGSINHENEEVGIYISEKDLELIEPTEMNSLLDIMLHNTNRLKDVST